jgi:seryl-tRNA synthetase/acyl carrier protein
MLTAHELEQRLLSFTREKLADPRIAPSITIDTRLFEDQVVDSLKILELIAFLQSTLGRRIPDSQIVLANFRSIATIARVFTGVESISQRRAAPRRGVRHFDTPVSPVDELLARRELELTADGALIMRGAVADLRDFLDSTVCDWANELGATSLSFPDDIRLSSLDQAGFTAAFPDKLVRHGEAAGSPAVCYHHYPTLSDCTVDASGSVVTALGRCFRNEFDQKSTHAVERLREFTMREIITVGTPQVVEGVRRNLMTRVRAWTKQLGLDGDVEVATDPFFTDQSRGRLLMQQLLPLKYELRLRADNSGRTLAAASFNNHHDHFGKAFRIRLASGESAHTGCVAFGWERWVVAFVNQHGADARNWPVTARKYVAATA